jgi:hypothetical protein
MLLAACNEKQTSSVANKAQVNSDTVASTVESLPLAATDYAADFVALEQYLKQFERPTQRFSVNDGDTKTITGAKGTRITVVPADLECIDGSTPSGKIDVELIELQNQEDLMRHGVTTTADGRLLESGGSYYINMRAGGKQLRLKSGRKLAVMFPKKTTRDMELFYGEENASGDVNWKATRQDFVAASANNNEVETASAGDSVLVRYELSNYRDTALETLEVRPNHPQKKVTAELVYQYGPINIKYKDGAYYYVGRVRDTVNRVYKYRKVAGIDKLANDYYEVMQLNKLGWINCDHFRSDELITLQAKTPATNSPHSIEALIIYKDINACDRRRVKVDEKGNVPLTDIGHNQTVKIIAFSWKNGGPCACTRTLRTSANAKIQLDLKPVTKEELNRMMVM